jgi:hypothetical protein
MVKYIPARGLNETADYIFTRHCIHLPPGFRLEDLFQPVAWNHVKARLQAHDIIRCIAHDGSFDVDLTVREVEVGGVHMTPRPHIGGVTGEAAMAELNKVAHAAAPVNVPLGFDGRPKVYVEYLAATKWRLIGINGEEVSRDHKDEATAMKAMYAYLASAGMVMPTEEEIEVELEAREKAEEQAKKPAPRRKSKEAA